MYSIKEKFDKYQSNKHYLEILSNYILNNLEDFAHINDVNGLSGIYLDKFGEKYSVERKYLSRDEADPDYFFERVLYEYIYGDRSLVEPYLLQFDQNIQEQINYVMMRYNNGQYSYGASEKQLPYDVFFRENDQSYRNRIIEKVYKGVRTNTIEYTKMYQKNMYGLSISLNNVLYGKIEDTLFFLSTYFKYNNDLMAGKSTDEQITFINYNPYTGTVDFSQRGEQSVPIQRTDGWVKIYDGITSYTQNTQKYTCIQYNGQVYEREILTTNDSRVIVPIEPVYNITDIYFFNTAIVGQPDIQISQINNGQYMEEEYAHGEKVNLFRIIKLNGWEQKQQEFSSIWDFLEFVIQDIGITDDYDILLFHNDGTNDYYTTQRIDNQGSKSIVSYNEIEITNNQMFRIVDQYSNEVEELPIDKFYVVDSQDERIQEIQLERRYVFIDDGSVKREAVLWYQTDTSSYILVDNDLITQPQQFRLEDGQLEYFCDVEDQQIQVSNTKLDSSWVQEHEFYYNPLQSNGVVLVEFTYNSENEIRYNLHIPSIKSFPVIFYYTDGSIETKIVDQDDNIYFDKPQDYFEIYLFDLMSNSLIYGRYYIQDNEGSILYTNAEMDDDRFLFLYNSNYKLKSDDENILLTLYKGNRTINDSIQPLISINEGSGMLNKDHFQQLKRDIKFYIDGQEITEDTFFFEDKQQQLVIDNVVGPFIPILYFNNFIKFPDEYINEGNVSQVISENVAFDNGAIETLNRTIYFGDKSKYVFNVRIQEPYIKFRIIYIHPMQSMYSEEVISPIMQYKPNNVPEVEVLLSGRNRLRLYNNSNIKINNVDVIIHNDGQTQEFGEIDRLESKVITLENKYEKLYQTLYIYDKAGRQHTQYVIVDNNRYEGYIDKNYGIIVQNNTINQYQDGTVRLEYEGNYSLDINILDGETLPIPSQCSKVYIDNELKYIKGNKTIVIDNDRVMGSQQYPQKIRLSNNRFIKVQNDEELLFVIKNYDIIDVEDLYGDIYEVYIVVVGD